MNRLQLWDNNIIRNDLIYNIDLRNIHVITKLKSLVLKSTVNSATFDSKDVLFSLISLEVLTNQKAKLLRTRKPVAAFKTKKLNPISSKVTLRKKALHTFLCFFINLVLPKVSDLKELRHDSLIHNKNSLSLGLSNLTLFPQLSKESEQLPKELGVTITFNLDSKKYTSSLLLLLLLSEYQIPVLIR